MRQIFTQTHRFKLAISAQFAFHSQVDTPAWSASDRIVLSSRSMPRVGVPKCVILRSERSIQQRDKSAVALEIVKQGLRQFANQNVGGTLASRDAAENRTGGGHQQAGAETMTGDVGHHQSDLSRRMLRNDVVVIATGGIGRLTDRGNLVAGNIGQFSWKQIHLNLFREIQLDEQFSFVLVVLRQDCPVNGDCGMGGKRHE